MNSQAETALRAHIRWMIRRDVAQVLTIEAASFAEPWSEEDLLRQLRPRNSIGMVSTISIGDFDDRILGFMTYQLFQHNLYVSNMAVHPSFRRRRIGTQMIEKLKGKLSAHRRKRIILDVRESNLDAHLFFRANGFTCDGIGRGHFENGEDAYRFVFRIDL